VRVTWLAVCEKIVHLADGSHHALRLYVHPLPWRPPKVHLPISAVFLLEGDEPGPIPVVVRILDARGRWVEELRQDVVVRPAAPLRPAFLDAHAEIDAPGDYEVQILVDGRAVDDAPTWKLRFVATGG
jgi:hypothetical protein